MGVCGEDEELESGVFEHGGGGGDGGLEGTLVGGFLDEGEDGVVVALEDDLAECLALVRGSLFEEIEDGEGEFSFAEVGAEGFTGFGFVAREVEDIVINLVSGAEAEAEDAEGFDDFWGGLIEEGPELAGDGEEGAGFHLDNFVIIGDGESEVEAALGLDDFAATDFAGGVGDGATDFAIGEGGGEFEGVSEEAIAEEDGDGVAPFGVGGGETSAFVGAVEDVVVDESGGVDEFDDHREVEVGRGDGAGGATAEEGEGWAEAFSAAFDGISDVAFDGRVEGFCLVADALFDIGEGGFDERKDRLNGFGSGGWSICESFHEELCRLKKTGVNSWTERSTSLVVVADDGVRG